MALSSPHTGSPIQAKSPLPGTPRARHTAPFSLIRTAPQHPGARGSSQLTPPPQAPAGMGPPPARPCHWAGCWRGGGAGGRETEGRREGLAASPPAGHAPISQHPEKPEAKGEGKRLEKLRWCLSSNDRERRHLARASPASQGLWSHTWHPRMVCTACSQVGLGAAALPLGALPHTQEAQTSMSTLATPDWVVLASRGSVHAATAFSTVSKPCCTAQGERC